MSQEIEKSYFLDFIPLLTIITGGPLGPDSIICMLEFTSSYIRAFLPSTNYFLLVVNVETS